MYVTSLFAVLPHDVTMEAIREVETLPRRYKSEDGPPAGLSPQVHTRTEAHSGSHTLFNPLYISTS
jgi:hypothetical protein